MNELKQKYTECTRCKLHDSRNFVVFGKGSISASILVLGEAPGKEEDLSGEPFVGRAGKVLDSILSEVDIDRNELFITNMVKCRPPLNRNPEKDELSACKVILDQEFDLIQPRVIVTLGSVPTRALIDSKAKITQIRGQWIKKDNLLFMPTYHPAYILRNPRKKDDVIRDFKEIKNAYKELGV